MRWNFAVALGVDLVLQRGVDARHRGAHVCD
jgi:hypothetical protein